MKEASKDLKGSSLAQFISQSSTLTVREEESTEVKKTILFHWRVLQPYFTSSNNSTCIPWLYKGLGCSLESGAALCTNKWSWLQKKRSWDQWHKPLKKATEMAINRKCDMGSGHKLSAGVTEKSHSVQNEIKGAWGKIQDGLEQKMKKNRDRLKNSLIFVKNGSMSKISIKYLIIMTSNWTPCHCLLMYQ